MDQETSGNEPEPSDQGLESAAPPRAARVLALAAIVVAGLCGGLIGFAVTDLQCDGDCDVIVAIGALVGAVGAAVGVAVVAVLTLRAMDEWQHSRPPDRSPES